MKMKGHFQMPFMQRFCFTLVPDHVTKWWRHGKKV